MITKKILHTGTNYGILINSIENKRGWAFFDSVVDVTVNDGVFREIERRVWSTVFI